MSNFRVKCLLILILILILVGNAWSEEKQYGLMKPDYETLLKWQEEYRKAPRAYILKELAAEAALPGKFNLLNHLNYIPSERNQGACGNCWVWAATGVMEIALDIEENIFDRLSVQYFNCRNLFACCGGSLDEFASFYYVYGEAIPWSNANAAYQDRTRRCGDAQSVSCTSMSTWPAYPVGYIRSQVIETIGIGKEQAIANIKNVLHQGMGIYVGFCLPNQEDWSGFHGFWRNQGENDTWQPDLSCGHEWGAGGACHAVLCVGYNDEDPENRYWIMVNSWGTESGRPNGIFHLDMDADYDCFICFGDSQISSLFWYTLDLEYGPRPTITVDTMDPNASEADRVSGRIIVSRLGETSYPLFVRYDISGTATNGSDYDYLSGLVTIPAGKNSACICVAPIDDAVLEGNETVVVTISEDLTYYIGSPSTAAVTITDNDGATSTVSIKALSAEISEWSRNNGLLRITRNGDTLSPLTAKYTCSGTAENGIDCNFLPGALTIPAGSSFGNIIVSPKDDLCVEGTEELRVTLSEDPSYVIGSPNTAAVVIRDNDKLPNVTIGAVDSRASENRQNKGRFTIRRTGSLESALSIKYEICGTAVNGNDYETLSESVTIPAGKYLTNIDVKPVDDKCIEGAETVIITLSQDPSYSVGSTGRAVVQIQDND